MTISPFSLQNAVSEPSSGRATFCLIFAKGDIPSGSIPQILNESGFVIPAQFDERSTPWKDLSAKLMVCHLFDADFLPDEIRTYSVTPVTGIYDNLPTKTLGDLTSQVDLKVNFANVTNYDGVDTTPRGSGSFVASLRDFAARPTRVKMYHSGRIAMSWRVWGLAKDTETGEEDQDLKVTFYVTAHLAADGTIADIEHNAKVSLDWWDVFHKTRVNYDAHYDDGDSHIQSYLGLQHPYHSAWRTLRTNDDFNNAKPFWRNQIPTLNYRPDKDYWVKTNIIPPLDTTFRPNTCWQVGYRSSYVPLSPQNHSAAPGAGGSHAGRGIVTNMDAIRFMDPLPDNARRARTCAEAGWGIPYHYKSIKQRKRPGEKESDVADTIIPLVMRPLPPSNYDFQSKGMPPSIDAYQQACQPNIDQTFQPKSGGNGQWTPETQSSHAISYSFMTYLFEGDRATMECCLELATNLCHQQAGTKHSGCPIYFYSDANGVPGLKAYTRILNIPPTQYSGLGSSRWVQNFRAQAWDMNISAHAALVVPENDEQSGAIQVLFRQRCVYHAANLPYIAQSQKNQGLWSQWVTSRYCVSPWMGSFIAQVFPYAALAMENQDLTNVVIKCTQFYPIAQWEGDTPYRSEDYRELVLLKVNDDYDPTTNAFLPRQKVLKLSFYELTPDRGINVSLGSISMPFTDGDVLYFPRTNEHGDDVPLPQGFEEATPYYAVNSSGLTCQVAASPGGEPIPLHLPDPRKTYAIAYQPQVWKQYPVMTPALFTIRADDYSPMSMAALVMTARVPGNAVTQKMLDAAKTFLAPVDFRSWVTWKFAPLPNTTSDSLQSLHDVDGDSAPVTAL